MYRILTFDGGGIQRLATAPTVLIILLLCGCAASPKKAGIFWSISQPAQVSGNTNSEARAISALFGGCEIRGKSNAAPKIVLKAKLLLHPIDPTLRDVRIDLRGGISLSEDARATCVARWNGQKVFSSRIPAEVGRSNEPVNESWQIDFSVPRQSLNQSRSDSLKIELTLFPGKDIPLDYAALDSVDINWHTNRVPVRSP